MQLIPQFPSSLHFLQVVTGQLLLSCGGAAAAATLGCCLPGGVGPRVHLPVRPVARGDLPRVELDVGWREPAGVPRWAVTFGVHHVLERDGNGGLGVCVGAPPQIPRSEAAVVNNKVRGFKVRKHARVDQAGQVVF